MRQKQKTKPTSTPLSYDEFFAKFNQLCNRREVGGSVMVICPGCKGPARLVALLTHPTRGFSFSEINCGRCGELYLGMKIETPAESERKEAGDD